MADTPSRFAIRHDDPYDVPAEEFIWPEGVPGFEPDGNNQEAVKERGEHLYVRFISNIRVPSMIAFPAKPENNTGKAVVVCPGGGYGGVAIDHEGYDIARFFNSLGISAFVLKYRCPAPDGRHGLWREGPLSDVLRTIRLVRSRASQYGIDPHKIGVMGFSSGGHVAVTASTLYDSLEDPNPALKGISARPDFSILIYAVISLCEEYGHSGSRNNLLGLDPSPEIAKKYSGEKMVTPDTPPVFLALTEDDQVHPLNSLNYYVACLQNKVPAEMHIYPEGGHGYGMRVRGFAVDSWIDRLAEWVTR